MNVRTILLALVGVITALFGVFVYGAGIFIGATFGSFPWWLLAFIPMIGQVYLILLIWQFTATLINLYKIALFIFVCLLVLFGIISRRGAKGRNPPSSSSSKKRFATRAS